MALDLCIRELESSQAILFSVIIYHAESIGRRQTVIAGAITTWISLSQVNSQACEYFYAICIICLGGLSLAVILPKAVLKSVWYLQTQSANPIDLHQWRWRLRKDSKLYWTRKMAIHFSIHLVGRHVLHICLSFTSSCSKLLTSQTCDLTCMSFAKEGC